MTGQQNFCPQCGSARQGALRFCATCGFDYWKGADPAAQGPAGASASPPPEQRPAEASTSPPPKKNTRLGCVALGVIAVIVIAIAANLGGDPAETARETPTPGPSRSDESTLSAEPTAAAPTVAATPIVTLPPEPAFAPIQLSGVGSSVPRFDIPADEAAIATLTHSGAANFIVWAVGETGEQQDLLVNTIGGYTGTVLFDEASGSHSVAFDIEADGPWTIEIKPITDAFRWDGSAALSGVGDDVAILDPPSSGLKSVTVTHQGDGNFMIWAYGPSTDLLVNEIGPYSGEALLNDGTVFFEIGANGPWTISPPQ